MTAAATPNFLTLGEAAARLGCQLWHVQRVYDRGLLPPPRRVGRCRVVTAEELPVIHKTLARAGFIRAAESAETG
jgi:hypothetical protein